MKRKGLIIAAVVVLAVVVLLALRPESGGPGGAAPQVTLTVDSVALEQQSWPIAIETSGSLAAWHEAIVSPETGGLRIAEVLVDRGATVGKGQLLARLSDESLEANRRKQAAVVAQAKANLAQATWNLSVARKVESSGALSAQRIQEYLTTEATAQATFDSAEAELASIELQLRQTRIIAPDHGFVSSRSAQLGNVVGIGAELFRIVRQGRIEWLPELDSQQLAAVRAGQVARIVLPGGAEVTGEVRLVGPIVDTDSGRGTVYVSLPPHEDVKPGIFVSGRIELGDMPAQTLPQSALTLRDGRAYVHVIDEQDHVSSHVVETGRRRQDRVEITSGLEPGTRVVASGGAFLAEGTLVGVRGADRVTAE